MKRVLVLVVAIMVMNVSRAQTDSGYVEVGMNAMRLLTFAGNQQGSSNPEIWNPYLFTIEGSMKKFGLRFGFSKYNYTNTELPVGVNGLTRYDNDTSSTDMRIGLLYNFNLDSKWTLKLGVDYVSSKRERIERVEFKEGESNEDVVTEETIVVKESGFSPFVNIQYHITPRVSLSTELLWRITTYTDKQLATDTRTDFSVDRNFEGKRNFIMPPTALFLTYRF